MGHTPKTPACPAAFIRRTGHPSDALVYVTLGIRPRSRPVEKYPPNSFCIVKGQDRTMAGTAHSRTFCRTRGAGARSGLPSAPEVRRITRGLSFWAGSESQALVAGRRSCTDPAAVGLRGLLSAGRSYGMVLALGPWSLASADALRDHPGRRLGASSRVRPGSRMQVKRGPGDAFHPRLAPGSSNRSG